MTNNTTHTMSAEQKNIRSIETLSMLNPLMEGDYLELDGPDGGDLWQVKRSGYGWKLVCDGKTHPTIVDIDGMADLIAAICEYCRGYFTNH